LFAGAVIVLVASAVVVSPMLDGARGLSIDILTALRWRVFGQRYDPAMSPTVVIGIDEESFRTPPFDGAPLITWTREIARVLTAVIEADAKVIGFDIVFPKSIEQSGLPFDADETFGSRVRGFDRDFLRALALAARSDKIVLGEVQRNDQPIRPSPGQLIVVGGTQNLRSLNTYTDSGDIVRRLPMSFQANGMIVPSMSLELASRALGVRPEFSARGSTTLASYKIPSAVPNTMTLNFEGGSDIPTFSLADLWTCAVSGDQDFFRRNFAGKVVLLGGLFDVEDLKLTSKRFATGGEQPRAQRCHPAEVPTRPSNGLISGVYLHATAVNNLIRKDAVVEAGRPTRGVVAAAFAAAAVALAFLLAPAAASLALVGLHIVWTAGAAIIFKQSFALPLLEPLLAGVIALICTISFRFVVTEKDKRFLRRSFAFYLAPAVIEKMMASNTLPELGGESRVLTVYFSDVAGFSSFSEKLTPADLVKLMNQYLSAMTEIIEEHHGFVDKYIGDAIIAVFGAPLDDPEHAANAVRAALQCQQRLAELCRSVEMFQRHPVRQRIGLNSGEALVGNIGSRRRFNYTAMGDVVNLASRLEGANKFFGTSILAAETTVALTESAFAWREIDQIRVKGRVQPVRIFEPLAAADEDCADPHSRVASYAEGLACWRAGEFVHSRDCFARNADTDPPSAFFLKRATALVQAAPDMSKWEPIYTLDEK